MNAVASDLMGHMRRECALLTAFHDAETIMKARVHQKDWDGLEQIIDELTRLADDLVETENARHEAFERLREHVGESQGATFYQIIVHLPQDARNAISELYRMMKFSVFGIQAVTYSMDDHVRTINDTLHDILGELYPHRKGNLYTHQGRKVPSGSNPMLFDAEL